MHRHTMIGVAVWLVMAPVGTLGTGRPFPRCLRPMSSY